MNAGVPTYMHNYTVLYSSIYIAPLNSRGPTEALLVRLAPRKRQVLRSDKEVERLDDKNEARAMHILHSAHIHTCMHKYMRTH